ncbi:MucR family transcriptional regulator [Lutibaculum baratangense]|nr:MucR family transcriptional regulator [Lutibaculum baratangense]
MLVRVTANIVSAYVGQHGLSALELPTLIGDVHRACRHLGQQREPEEVLEPAVAPNRSVKRDHIVCLDCGKTFKSLKRHLRAEHNLSPEQYRERWALAADYPMVAPNYAATRSRLAKEMGLGGKIEDSGRGKSGA